MATDFWSSSHYKRWIVDRATVKQARAEDLQYVDVPEHLDLFAIYFANCISKLGKKLQLRQRVIATATIFFHRFYLRNSYCETDPFIVIAACCYVAAKAEEAPIHIKNVINDARSLFSQDHYNVKSFPSDNTKLAEMEFYLVDDLECDLIVFHPYRTLLALCRKESTGHDAALEEVEAGEVGIGIGSESGPRYWGTGEGQLEVSEGTLQTAWFIINDTYRSPICLMYPPHLIAIAAIYLAFVLYAPARATISTLLPSGSEPGRSSEESGAQAPRRSSRQTQGDDKKPQDPIAFLAGLNVSLPLVATLVQEIISLYSLWERYKEDTPSDSSSRSHRDALSQAQSPYATGSSRTSPAKRSHAEMARSTFGTPEGSGDIPEEETYVTPVFLAALLNSMREKRMSDVAHLPTTARPVMISRMLERTL